MDRRYKVTITVTVTADESDAEKLKEDIARIIPMELFIAGIEVEQLSN